MFIRVCCHGVSFGLPALTTCQQHHGAGTALLEALCRYSYNNPGFLYQIYRKEYWNLDVVAIGGSRDHEIIRF
jgi:hypothetical protein